MVVWLLTGLSLAIVTFVMIDHLNVSEGRLNLFITIVGTVVGIILAFIADDLRQQADDRERIIGLLNSSLNITQQRLEKVKIRLEYAQSEIYSESAMKTKFHDIVAIQAKDEIFTVLLHNGELFMKLSKELRRHLPIFIDNAHWFDSTYQPKAFENDQFIEYTLSKYSIQLEQQIDYIKLEMMRLNGTISKKEFVQRFIFLELDYSKRMESLQKSNH